MKIIDKNNLWNRLRKTLFKTHNSYVSVGVHSTAEPYESGKSVAEVAHAHEYGTEIIPQRSFFRSTLKAKESEIKTRIDTEYKKIISLKKSIEKVLSTIGLFVSNQIKHTITTSGANANIEWEPLKFIKEEWPKSRWPKPRSKQLIDSGRLRKSISYEVHV